jgi:hypothetical protein
MPSMATASGHRLLPAPGNVWLSTRWSLRGLKAGTYYWSVQAIDHSYAPSAFAEEQSFVVGSPGPVVFSSGASNITPSGAELNALLSPNGAPGTFWFEYGPTNSFNFSTPPKVYGSGTNNLPVSEFVGHLQPITTNLYRVVASNEFGISYSAPSSFILPKFQPFSLIRTSSVPNSSSLLWAVNIDTDPALEWIQSTWDANHKHVLAIPAGLDAPPGEELISLGDYRGATNGQKLSVAWADLDRDGDMDFAFPVIKENNIIPREFKNFGDRNFAEVQLSETFTNIPHGSVAWGDADNDGDLDLLVPWSESGLGTPVNRLYINRGDGMLEDAALLLPPLENASCSWADYDNDGRVDFLLCGTNVATAEQSCLLFHNEGNGKFTQADAGLPGVTLGRSTWCDMDNDGDLDLFLRGIDTTGIVRQYILVNDGSGHFAEIDLPNGSGSGLWGDYDNDGWPDILAPSGQNLILRGTGANGFSPVAFAFQNALPQNALWVDADGDGTLDLLTRRSAQFGYVAALYRNNTILSNAIPSVPDGLESTVNGDSVWLRWNPTVDANQLGGHSYNVRVGTKPAARDIVSPHADLATGKLLQNELGNAGLRRNFLLERLAPGDYYWSVQAVDHSYASSQFGAEQKFVISGRISFRFTQIIQSNSDILLNIEGPSGENATIESSSNLQDWTSVGSARFTNGVASIELPLTGKSMFFRARGN